MAFIGNTPAESYVVTVKDSFNGTGSQTDFTLSQASTTNDVRVVVENVVQEPTTAYTVSGTTLTFTSAPPSGTGNIYVIHLGPAVATAVPPETFGVGSIYGASDPDTAITFEGSGVTTFDQNGTEAARFDANGKLLVGTTTVAPGSTQGVIVYEDGRVFATSDGTYAGYFNRLTSDGDIVIFRKDGTTVGSIGIADGDLHIISTASNHGGVRFATSGLIPVNNTGGISDDSRDLGQANVRWQDLYLSGGVYLGGTGAANYLDDYEEGTFTLNVTDGTTSKSATGNYKKVGSLVYVRGGIANIESGGAFSGTVYMTGLPFTPASASFISSFINYTSTATSWSARASNDGSIRFFRFGSASLDNEELDGGDVGLYTDITISGCYDI